MVLPVTSQYKSVAHGALNWDTQAKADAIAFEAGINGALGTDGTIGFSGTVSNYSSVWSCFLRRAGNLVHLKIGINPGANGLSPSTSNRLILTCATGYRPIYSQVFWTTISPDGGTTWSGGFAQVQVDATGNVYVMYSNPTNIPNGALLTGATTFEVAA